MKRTNIKIKVNCSILILFFTMLAPLILVTTSAFAVETRITNSGGSSINPSMSGNVIVWQDYRNGNYDIYMYNLSSHVETPVCTASMNQINPVIQGNLVAWEDWRNGWPQIYYYRINIPVPNGTQVSASTSEQRSPSVYGDKIVWHDYRNGNYDIYMYNLSASTLTNVTNESHNQTNPSIWGSEIVWQDDRNISSQHPSNIDIYRLYNGSLLNLTNESTYSMQKNPYIYNNRVVWEDLRNYGNSWDIWTSYPASFPSTIASQVSSSANYEFNPSTINNKIVWDDDHDIYKDVFSGSTHAISQVTTNASDQRNPVTNGSTIVWQDKRHEVSNDNNWEIYADIPSSSSNSGGTGIGTRIMVNLGGSNNLIFDTVTNAGTTTLAINDSAPYPELSGFNFVGSHYDISTTATYSGNIRVTLSYDPDAVGNENNLKLFHWENGTWNDVTVSVDTPNNTISGDVTSLSPFEIGEGDGSGSPLLPSGGPITAGYSDFWLILTTIFLIIAGGYYLWRREVVTPYCG